MWSALGRAPIRANLQSPPSAPVRTRLDVLHRVARHGDAPLHLDMPNSMSARMARRPSSPETRGRAAHNTFFAWRRSWAKEAVAASQHPGAPRGLGPTGPESYVQRRTRWSALLSETARACRIARLVPAPAASISTAPAHASLLSRFDGRMLREEVDNLRPTYATQVPRRPALRHKATTWTFRAPDRTPIARTACLFAERPHEHPTDLPSSTTSRPTARSSDRPTHPMHPHRPVDPPSRGLTNRPTAPSTGRSIAKSPDRYTARQPTHQPTLRPHGRTPHTPRRRAPNLSSTASWCATFFCNCCNSAKETTSRCILSRRSCAAT